MTNYNGTATLAGTGSITATGAVGKVATASRTGTGTITATSGAVAKYATVTRTGTGTITATTGVLGRYATATRTGTGAIVVDGALVGDPVADAGADQTNVEPFTTILLNGSVSNGQAPFTYEWTQISGPTVSIVDATTLTPFFVMPPQATPLAAVVPVVLRLTVTDDNSAVDTDDVSITALAWDLWWRAGGTWQPRRPLRYRSGGGWVT